MKTEEEIRERIKVVDRALSEIEPNLTLGGPKAVIAQSVIAAGEIELLALKWVLGELEGRNENQDI